MLLIAPVPQGKDPKDTAEISQGHCEERSDVAIYKINSAKRLPSHFSPEQQVEGFFLYMIVVDAKIAFYISTS